MKHGALVGAIALLAAVLLVVAGCGGGGKKEDEDEGGAASAQAQAACTGSPLTAKPKLPASFPMVENTTLTKQSTEGPTNVVEGYWKGSLKDAHDEYKRELEGAGYAIVFDELEDHDSEVSWKGEGRTGQVALREDCADSDKIYVHITNRPA
ncbi:MAG TPA: hypothetical protein VH297_06305 [Gaiellaceae bacterium]|jgi:hypothetical protein